MIGIGDHTQRRFDRADRLAMPAEVTEHCPTPVQRFGAMRCTMQCHLDGGESGEIITRGRCDLRLEEPAVDTVGCELERVIDGQVRISEHRVVTCAKQLSRVLEQSL